MRRIRLRHACVILILLYSLYIFLGVSDFIRSRDFDGNFDYPLNVDIKPVIEEVIAGRRAPITPINYYKYRFLTNSRKCSFVDSLTLFIVVKSAMNHFEHRDAIRQTYGQENSIQGKNVKVLFFLGVELVKTDLQKKIKLEMATHRDVIQMDFYDSYFNNTIKTMMSMRWLYEHCSSAKFYLFTDDDMYISVHNLLIYLDEWEQNAAVEGSTVTPSKVERHLFAGYVFKSGPHRILGSKWRVSLEEYPWNKWPPYVTAGAYVLSNKSMKVLFVASLFVKHFRFDDIYLGIVAKKAGVPVTHCDQFHFYKKKYSKEGYRDVIASHGYSDHSELVRVWKEQNCCYNDSKTNI